MSGAGRAKRRWRQYETAKGKRPVREFIDALPMVDRAAVVSAMGEVKREGLSAAKPVRGEIYEVIASGDRVTYRILFAPEGDSDQVLLALEGLNKKSQKLPKKTIDTAQKRLKDWRARSRTATGKPTGGKRGRRPRKG
jgi:phage-related protein